MKTKFPNGIENKQIIWIEFCISSNNKSEEGRKIFSNMQEKKAYKEISLIVNENSINFYMHIKAVVSKQGCQDIF